MATSERTSSTLVRVAKFLKASKRGLPARISVVTSRISSASAGWLMSSSSLVFMIAWSIPEPASMHTIIRSSASGRPCLICFCRCDVARPSQTLGSTKPNAAPSKREIPTRETERRQDEAGDDERHQRLRHPIEDGGGQAAIARPSPAGAADATCPSETSARPAGTV